MTLQVLREIRTGERTLFVRVALSFASAGDRHFRIFAARFMNALAESRRKEAARIVRHYSDLLDDSRASGVRQRHGPRN